MADTLTKRKARAALARATTAYQTAVARARDAARRYGGQSAAFTRAKRQVGAAWQKYDAAYTRVLRLGP